MRTALGIGLVLSLGLLLFPALGVPWVLALTAGGAIVARLRGRSAWDYLRSLDELAATGERALVATALSVMTVVVFIDVVWRTSHSVDAAGARGFVGAFLALCLMGGLTARWPEATRAKRLLAGLGAFALVMGIVVLIHSAPRGFGWSQRLALVLLMWVGLLGASLASKWGRHIQVDAVRRVVPERWQRTFEVLAELVTLALLVMLTLLAQRYAGDNWIRWIESGRRTAVFESLPIPYWTASLPIVVGFFLMLVRSLRALFEGPVKAELLEALGGGDRSEASLGSDPSQGVSSS